MDRKLRLGRVALCCCVLGWAAYASAGVEELSAVLDDETRAVETMRSYHHLQVSLFEWDRELARELHERGEEDLAEAKAEGALARLASLRSGWERVLERYPDNARAHNYFGELLYDHLGDRIKAVMMWKTAEALDDDLAAAKNNLALYYSEAGDYELCYSYITQAVEADPDHPDYLHNIVQIYLIHYPQIERITGWDKEKIYKEAMKYSKRAAELKPNDFTLQEDYAINFFAASNFDVTPDWKDAAKAWQATRALARDRNERFFCWLYEARAWVREENSEQARACLIEALKIRPTSRPARNLLNSLEAKQPEE